MAVRVRIRILNEIKEKEKVLTVLVNGGAESEEPVIVISKEDALDLGLSLGDFEVVEVELASGKTHNLISKKKFKIELLDEKSNVLSSSYAYVAADENLIEPLITDATIDELGISVISFKKGLWRHMKDPSDKVRESIKIEKS